MSEKFPTRRGSSGIHTHRKLFAKGFPPGVTPVVFHTFIPTGNFSQNIDSPSPVPYNEGILTNRISPGKELSP